MTATMDIRNTRSLSMCNPISLSDMYEDEETALARMPQERSYSRYGHGTRSHSRAQSEVLYSVTTSPVPFYRRQRSVSFQASQERPVREERPTYRTHTMESAIRAAKAFEEAGGTEPPEAVAASCYTAPPHHCRYTAAPLSDAGTTAHPVVHDVDTGSDDAGAAVPRKPRCVSPPKPTVTRARSAARSMTPGRRTLLEKLAASRAECLLFEDALVEEFVKKEKEKEEARLKAIKAAAAAAKEQERALRGAADVLATESRRLQEKGNHLADKLLEKGNKGSRRERHHRHRHHSRKERSYSSTSSSSSSNSEASSEESGAAHKETCRERSRPMLTEMQLAEQEYDRLNAYRSAVTKGKVPLTASVPMVNGLVTTEVFPNAAAPATKENSVASSDKPKHRRKHSRHSKGSRRHKRGRSSSSSSTSASASSCSTCSTPSQRQRRHHRKHHSRSHRSHTHHSSHRYSCPKCDGPITAQTTTPGGILVVPTATTAAVTKPPARRRARKEQSAVNFIGVSPLNPQTALPPPPPAPLTTANVNTLPSRRRNATKSPSIVSNSVASQLFAQPDSDTENGVLLNTRRGRGGSQELERLQSVERNVLLGRAQRAPPQQLVDSSAANTNVSTRGKGAKAPTQTTRAPRRRGNNTSAKNGVQYDPLVPPTSSALPDDVDSMALFFDAAFPSPSKFDELVGLAGVASAPSTGRKRTSVAGGLVKPPSKIGWGKKSRAF